jgi:proteasome lid subunit RPN8/RPN11
MSKGIKVKVKAQPAVVLEAEVARKIRQHARSSMKAEVCGVLLGVGEEDRTVVEACIAGINAAQGGAHVTFTQDTWEHIYKIKDQQFPDMKIVGWYHSHPGFGVFLSEHDLFIQENFFSNPQQIAWVYDPHTDEEGCFGWIGGKIEKLPGIRFGYSQSVDASVAVSSEEVEDGELEPAIRLKQGPADDEPEWVKWIGRILTAFSLSALGFAAGLFFWDLSPWARSALNRLADDIRQQQMQLLQTCGPELQACQARVLQTPVAPLSPASPGTVAPGQQSATQPQTKGPTKSGKGDNGKH